MILKFITPTFIFICVLGYSCTKDSGDAFLDFSQCGCQAFHNDIVCGEDGRTYLDSCFAKCLNVQIAGLGSCPNAFNDPNDTMKWPIELVCIPVATEDDPKQISVFSDGSVLYQEADGHFFRGTFNKCRCLHPLTLIATPSGAKSIESLNQGDAIWTLDLQGDRISQPVKYIIRTPVPEDYQILYLLLNDGRELTASPRHPDANQNELIELIIGDCLDGSVIVGKSLILHDHGYTMDLVPSGETGYYFANDILISSTISTHPPLE